MDNITITSIYICCRFSVINKHWSQKLCMAKTWVKNFINLY